MTCWMDQLTSRTEMVNIDDDTGNGSRKLDSHCKMHSSHAGERPSGKPSCHPLSLCEEKMWGKVLIGINRMRCFIELVNL